RSTMARRTALAGAAGLALMLLSQPLPRAEEAPVAAAGPSRTGTLKGTVVIGPQITSRRLRFNLYEDFWQTAAVAAHPLADGMSNVVVYLEPLSPRPAGARRTPGPLRIEQRDQSFTPHTLAVLEG